MHRSWAEGRHDLACSSAGRTGQSPFECPARHSRSGADPPAARCAGGCRKWCFGTVEDYVGRDLSKVTVSLAGCRADPDVGSLSHPRMKPVLGGISAKTLERSSISFAMRSPRPGGALLFVEHGRAPEPGVARWQDRLDPLWSRLAGGCHLNRKVDDLMTEAGFRIEALEHSRLPGPPTHN